MNYAANVYADVVKTLRYYWGRLTWLGRSTILPVVAICGFFSATLFVLIYGAYRLFVKNERRN